MTNRKPSLSFNANNDINIGISENTTPKSTNQNKAILKQVSGVMSALNEINQDSFLQVSNRESQAENDMLEEMIKEQVTEEKALQELDLDKIL